MPTLDRPPMGKSTLVQVDLKGDKHAGQVAVVCGVPFLTRANNWWVAVQLVATDGPPLCYPCASLKVVAKKVKLGSNGKK